MSNDPDWYLNAGAVLGRMVRNGEATIRWPAYLKAQVVPNPIPEGAMRVGPGSDAVVWKICPDYSGEL